MKPPHLEIGASNETDAKDFFSDLFGWAFVAMEHGGYFDAGTVKAGLHGGETEPSIVVYFDVPDLDAAVLKVRALGGRADDPGAYEPGFGRFAACVDPQGLKFGLME